MRPPHATHSLPRVPDYELVRLIGRGSYGEVWLARGVLGVWRAVKVVWRNRFAETLPYLREYAGIRRFAAVSLREPSQLALLHAGRNEAQGFFYYVMELADCCEGGREVDPELYAPLTLRELRLRRGRLAAAQVADFGAALAEALLVLHGNGLVHRDIKPSNIVVVEGSPKLADVGLVAVASAEPSFVGTAGFVPPEGGGAPAADLYSLGLVLYELATGLERRHFPRLPPEFPHWPDRGAFLELNEVILRACDHDLARRFREASALLEELKLVRAGGSVRKKRRRGARARWGRRLLAGWRRIARAGPC